MCKLSCFCGYVAFPYSRCLIERMKPRTTKRIAIRIVPKWRIEKVPFKIKKVEKSGNMAIPIIFQYLL